jgi:uncharacterized protein
MNPRTQAILLSDNPWLRSRDRLVPWLDAHVPDEFVRREAASSMTSAWARADSAHLVVGPRQAGKSTMIWAHLANKGEPVLLVDCEQASVREWCSSPPLFLDDLDRLIGERVPLLFEEVQHLDEAGLFLKGLVDRRVGAPLLVTGSSAYDLRARTRESLAGRATRTRLLPFSFAEVCRDIGQRAPIVRAQLEDERLERHLVFGGFPLPWLSEEPEPLLHALVESVILRDASDIFRVARPDAFRRLLELIARQSGSMVNLEEWASLLGISRDTVASYLNILEDSHVIVRLRPYVGGRRSELTSRPKVYLTDNGIRHALLPDFRPLAARADVGAILESWVFTELWKTLPSGATLHFWRSTSGAEVDFVISHGDKLRAVEVKAEAARRPRLPRASRSFIEAYQPESFAIVHRGIEHTDRLGDTQLRWIRPRHLFPTVFRKQAA